MAVAPRLADVCSHGFLRDVGASVELRFSRTAPAAESTGLLGGMPGLYAPGYVGLRAECSNADQSGNFARGI